VVFSVSGAFFEHPAARQTEPINNVINTFFFIFLHPPAFISHNIFPQRSASRDAAAH